MEKVICSIFWFGWLYTIAIGILLEYTIWCGIILLFLIIIFHSITIVFAIAEYMSTYKKNSKNGIKTLISSMVHHRNKPNA